ncbi:MAG: cobalt ECF transporter T component CbiQ [Syntrophaceticus sp.]|nr:cobalt ECF transporter T component CbiQ [Syntrophaceticus sp.]MDD3315626.1 cobalt ECF transporter T component CbiQ [Syntrophaceticus sp.]MDD4360731.1 cobalt ECF transporter T component CbiQ [Syntrophaceticus sp.]MDD4783877.1 cobalt ECF transporter T component CbiQ [Syntrophaceticus sp.]
MDAGHVHLDEFTHFESPFHRFDPRVKIVSCLILLVMVVTLKSPVGLAAALFAICLLIMVSHLPVGRILKRVGIIIPFVIAIGLFLPVIQPGTPLYSFDLNLFTLNVTYEGLQGSILFFLRIICAALLIILVTFTTPFHVLLRSLSDLRIPQIFTHLIQFTLRYFFVLYDEILRMRRARRSRNFELGKTIWSRRTLSTIGGLIGVLFIRSYERGERVYYSMMSRGFRGEMQILNDLQVETRDIIWGVVIVLLGVTILLIDQGGWGWPLAWK